MTLQKREKSRFWILKRT